MSALPTNRSVPHLDTLDDSSTSISAVLPAYNEEAVIESTVRHVADVLRDLVPDFEVVVTNDGSRDGTGAILTALEQQEQQLNLRVVTHDRNHGYGAALADGFDAARKSLIFMTDGDKQFDVAEVSRFLPAIEAGADLAIGWRRKRADPPMRLLNARGWKLLVNGMFGYTARDVDCAFKLFRRSVWQALTVHARGATFSAELLVKARRLGFQVEEIPVSHYPRTAGSATGARPSVIARAFKELFQLRRNLDRELADDSALHTHPRRVLTSASSAPPSAEPSSHPDGPIADRSTGRAAKVDRRSDRARTGILAPVKGRRRGLAR
jgi:glycosyltransferase involved in cell wall biosynthesis